MRVARGALLCLAAGVALIALAGCVTPVDEPAATYDALVTVLVAEADTGVSDLGRASNRGGTREVSVNEDAMLVRFGAAELAAAIPGADALASATLELTVTTGPAFSTLYEVHRMTVPWVEGSGDGRGGLLRPGETNGATAVCGQDADITDALQDCVPGTEWDLYGRRTPPLPRPFVETPTATVTIPRMSAQPPPPFVISFDVTADVRAFLASGVAPNAGWFVRGPVLHTTDTRAVMATREFCGVPADAACPQAPHLVLRTRAAGVEPSPPPLDRSVTTGVFDANRFLVDQRVQEGVEGFDAPGGFDEVRAAVVRGLVKDATSGNALSGVEVRVLHTDHLGTTVTRVNGQFDLMVEGGSDLVLAYHLDGYMPAQRLVHVPVNDYVWASDVALVRVIDPATQCSLPVGGASTVYRANTGGVRSLHIYLPAGAATTSGTPVERVCALEYTRDTTDAAGAVIVQGEDAMPADLPAASGYTMAVELEARDSSGTILTGAVLATPGAVWIEDTGATAAFPDGEPVPTGVYDYNLGAWKSEEDGRVLDVRAGGPGCIIDSGAPALTLTSDEHDQLCATFASAGARVWRVPLEHFSTHDFNWPLNFFQNDLVPFLEWANEDVSDDTCTTPGSTIGCEDQSLGEDLPLAGTPFELHYSSDRQTGRRDRYDLDIRIPAAPPSVAPPVMFQGVRLEIQVAGNRFRYSPATDTQFRFEWDGRDGWGRMTQGAQPITVRLGFVFTTTYLRAAPGGRSFALAGDNTDITVNVPSREVVLWRTRRALIGGWDARGEELGGFSISAHHVYDARARTLYRGDGTRYSSPGIGEVIALLGDIPIPNAISLAVAPDGTLYVGQSGAGASGTRIWRTSRDGRTELFAGTVAGDPTPIGAVPPESVLASAAAFRSPVAMAVQRDGSLLVVERDNHCVRAVRETPGGRVVTRFAGACRGAVVGGDCTTLVAPVGDGYPALDANLLCPNGVAVAPDGAVYIADLTPIGVDERIRRVDPGGMINTFARLAIPSLRSALAVDREGRLLVLGADRLRRITAFASNEVLVGQSGCTVFSLPGDGLLGRSACITRSEGLAVGPDGSLFVSHGAPGRVRRLGPAGIVTTVAGGGTSLVTTGPARSARLDSLNDVAVLPDGRVVVAESGGVRVVRSALPDVFVGEVVVPEPDGSLTYVFNDRGQHLSTRDGLTNQVLLEFGYVLGRDQSIGMLDSVTERGGTDRITRIARDGLGAPRAIVGPFFQRTEFGDLSGGYLTTMTVPGGTVPRTWTFALGSAGLLDTLTDPVGSIWDPTFDAVSGRLTSEVEPLGTRIVGLDRDECRPEASWCDAASGELGSRTTLTEGPGARQASVFELVSESWGGTRRRQVDALGAETLSVSGVPPVTLTAPLATLPAPLAHTGSTTESVPVSYRAQASDGSTVQLAAGIDPRPELGEYIRAARICRDAACTTAMSYTAFRTATVAARAVPLLKETVTWNGTRRYTTSVNEGTRPAGCPGDAPVWITETSPRGLTLADSARKRYTCLDAFGRAVRVEEPGMEPVVVSYDASSGGVARVTQGTRITSYSYRLPIGSPTPFVQKVTAALTPSSLVLSLDRDEAGWVGQSSLRVAGAATDTWSVGFAHDARGDVTNMTLPHGEQHALGWTALGALRRYEPPWHDDLVPALGRESTGTLDTPETAFDPLHRPTQETLYGLGPSGGQTTEDVTVEYDPRHGTFSSLLLPDGRSISALWDVSADPLVSATGRLESLTGPDGVGLAFGYDGPLLTRETWTETATGTVRGEVSRVVNAFGENSSVTAAGLTRYYARELDAQLTCVGATDVPTLAAPCVGGLVTATALVGVGAVQHWERTTALGSVATTEVFDRFGAPAQITVGPVAAPVFTWAAGARDQLGRLTEETDSWGTRRYAYDASGNLQTVRDGVGSPGRTLAAYTYDANGNRLSASYPSPGGRDFAGMRRLGAEPGAIVYDHQDRLKQYADCTFDHDAEGSRTVQVCTGRTGSVVGDVTLAHDRLGNLRSATDLGSAGRPVEVRYEVDALGRRTRRQVLERGALLSSEERRWLWLDGLRPAAELDGAGALRWLFVWGTRANLPDYAVRGSDRAVFRLIGDARGSLRVAVNVATGATETHDYDPFGVELPPRHPGPETDFGLPFRFAGGMWEPRTHLLRFGARDYDPITGRWVQKDPSLFDGGDTNLYAYAGNDPVNYIDMDGENPALIGFGIGCALGGGVELLGQLLQNGASFGCVNWGSVVSACVVEGVIGAVMAVGLPPIAGLRGLRVAGGTRTNWIGLVREGEGQLIHLGQHPLPMRDLTAAFGRARAGQLRNTSLVHLGVKGRHYPLNILRRYL